MSPCLLTYRLYVFLLHRYIINVLITSPHIFAHRRHVIAPDKRRVIYWQYLPLFIRSDCMWSGYMDAERCAHYIPLYFLPQAVRDLVDAKLWAHPVSSWFFLQRVRAIEGYIENNVLILPGVSTYRKSVIWSGSCKMTYWPSLMYWLTGGTWSGHTFTCWELCWWCLIILLPTGCTWAQQVDMGRYTHGVPYFHLQIVSNFIRWMENGVFMVSYILGIRKYVILLSSCRRM